MKATLIIKGLEVSTVDDETTFKVEGVKQERIMNIEEAAEALGLAVPTIKKYLREKRFPNAVKVPVREGSAVKRWDIPESDLASFEAPPSPGPKPKPEDELTKRRHISVSPDVDEYLTKRQEADSAFNVSAFINGLVREVMSREEY